MFKNYFKIAWRNLTRNKVYSLINIAGLSLGLACAMLIILYTKDELSYDKFHALANNIYRITIDEVNPDGGIAFKQGNTGYFQGPAFKSAIPEIVSFVRLQGGYRNIKIGTEIKGQEIYMADSSFFSLFSFPLLSGNPTTALLQPKSVVISEDMAKRYFGTTDAMNKTMFLKEKDSFEPYLVSAIVKKCPQNSSLKFEILIPLEVPGTEMSQKENWFNQFLNTFVLLRPNANLKKVEAAMKQAYQSDAKDAIKVVAEKYGIKSTAVHHLQLFTDLHLSKDYGPDNGLVEGSNPMYSYILGGIALFILLIACINFINLTIARSLKRAKEIGVRKVVGGDRKQLILQFMGESFLLCTAAFLFALVLVQLVLPTFNELSNKALSITYLLDAKLVAGYVALLVITGFLAGLYPALIISTFSPVQTLYSRFRFAGKNYLQKSLVILQFALATLLIIATITIYSQFNYLTKTDLGYDDSNTIMTRKEKLTRQQAKLFKEELMKNPNILAFAAKNGGRWGTVAKVNGESEIHFEYETVDESYLPMFNIPILKGRNFSTAFPSDSSHSVLVNETFVKNAGWKNPIGQQVNFWYNNNEKYTVIGVVKDYHYRPLSEKIGEQLFTMKASNSYGIAFMKIKPGSATASLQHLAKTYKKLFPLSPYEYKFKDLENLKSYEAEAKWKQMILFGALLTIFISCIGLFGLSVSSAEKRTKEIGIRKVLGASANAIIATLSKDFLKLVTIALVIAMPTAWWLSSKWLQSYPYRIELNAWMFFMAGMLVLVIALCTVSFQAIKAALANPTKSLRSE